MVRNALVAVKPGEHCLGGALLRPCSWLLRRSHFIALLSRSRPWPNQTNGPKRSHASRFARQTRVPAECIAARHANTLDMQTDTQTMPAHVHRRRATL